ncbi:hypothetical protein ACAF76_020745 [Brevibacillus sp. TJ4]|uniref:hypothetical protein n=1 Tax=Brevibacillus sp. TJ4 TaxID=3234853 RepID=UPI0037CFD61F
MATPFCNDSPKEPCYDESNKRGAERRGRWAGTPWTELGGERLFVNNLKRRKKPFLIVELIVLGLLVPYLFVAIAYELILLPILYSGMSLVFFIRVIENFMRKSNLIVLIAFVILSVLSFVKHFNE